MMAAVADWLQALAGEPLLLLLAAVAFLAWLLSLAVLWRRIERWPWRLAQGVTSAAALLALLAVLHPPAVRIAVGTATLVTPGVGEAALERVAPGDDLFVIDAAWDEPAVRVAVNGRGLRADAGRTVRIAAIDDVLRYRPDVARLAVIGDGLDAHSWFASHFAGDIVFTAPNVGAGIVDARYQQRLAIGERLTIDVRTRTAADTAELQLELRDEDGALLTAIPTAASTPTRLTVDGLSPGRQVLRLSLLDAGEGAVIETVPLPLQVLRPSAARLLLLQAAPSFEWRALARWAAGSGADVAARIRVSESRYRTRQSASLAIDPGRIDPVTLSGVDLVVADGAALAQLDAAAIGHLLSPSHGAGVLLLLHDEQDLRELPPAIADLITVAGDDARIYRFADMAEAPETGLSRLSVDFDGARVTSLLRDARGRDVAVRWREQPHVALSLLRDSYRLVGTGQAELHARLWSGLVTSLARPAASADAMFEHESGHAGFRLRVCMTAATGSDTLRVSEADGRDYVLPLFATPWLPALRCGWLWPASPGWLSVSDDGQARGSYFVLAREDWRSRQQAERVAATQQRATSTSPATDGSATRRVAIPRDWPFMVWLALSLLSGLTQRLAAALPGQQQAR